MHYGQLAEQFSLLARPCRWCGKRMDSISIVVPCHRVIAKRHHHRICRRS
ncbi:MGMT family protein [Escherichia coli]